MKIKKEKMDNKVKVDSCLVEKVRNGDIAAFETLFIRMNRILIKFAYQFLQDDELAENVVQDVFFAVYKNRKQLDPSSNIKTYLFTATKNHAFTILRKNKYERNYRQNHLGIIRRAGNTDEQLLYNDLKVAFYNAINELPEKCRLVFSMNRIDDLSYSEIASILNLSRKTVETHMRRALIHIRKKLAPYL